MSAATTSEPHVVGSILFGADHLVGEFVKSRIPQMRGRNWGEYSALGVVLGGELVGGVVYNNYRQFDISVSAAIDKIGWARRGTLRALFSYPFVQLGCQRITATTGRKNKAARKAILDLGFSLEGVCKCGYDGREDAFVYGMLKEQCRWLKDRK